MEILFIHMPKKIFFTVLAALLMLLFLEAGAWIVSCYFEERGVVYVTSKITPEEYKNYLMISDPVLGWSSPPREDLSFPSPDKSPACVSLYGDSFVAGNRIAQWCWSNLLSRLLSCRVANYGVGAYGTDQAYLRFRNNRDDTAHIVILGFVSENILRNINRYRDFLYSGQPWSKFNLKPRFVLNAQGELILIPLPEFSYGEFLREIDSPTAALKGEYFLPGGESGIFRCKFPYTLTVIKVWLRNFHIRAKLKGFPMYAEFYAPGHPSGALGVSFAIIKQFCQEAKAAGRRPVILVMPTCLDFKYYQKHGDWAYANITTLLKNENIEFLDAGEKMERYLQGRNPLEIFETSGHFNREGENLLANIVYQYLKENALF